MNYVEKVLDGVHSVFNLNAATLSGAIDIIVVPQEDGTLKSTAFHVRFGKFQSLVADEKLVFVSFSYRKVTIFVNDEQIDLTMKLGKAGEAYFIHDIPENFEVEERKPSTNPNSDQKDPTVANESGLR